MVGAPTAIQKRYGCGFKKFVIIPFLKDCALTFCRFNSMPFIVMLSYARYTINNAPEIDIVPSTRLKLDSFAKTKTDSNTIGISVRIGALATNIPSFLLCLIVSEMTKVNKGPGDIPATNPNNIPEIKNGRDSIIKYFHMV